MMHDEIRDRMDALWVSANRAADELRDPFVAMERVAAFYAGLGAGERAGADEVLGEWVMSTDEAKRFDAIALVRELSVRRAVPALRALTMRLGASDDPGAPFEREKVESSRSRRYYPRDSRSGLLAASRQGASPRR